MVKNTATGDSRKTRRASDIIGQNLKDPFFDSYKSEGIECHDIIKLIGECSEKNITVVFDKIFLKKLIHSHIYFIQDMEKARTGINYVH